MIRIVGVEHAGKASGEFVLLQNQCSMRQKLRGHALISEAVLDFGLANRGCYVFPDDEYIQSGAFVLLQSGFGEPRWSRSKDGALIYITFMNRSEPMWDESEGALHLLNIQHSFAEKRVAVCR